MPSQLFTLARSFKANANGKIYVGKIDTDPSNPANQIPIYLESESGENIQVAQPIRINSAGFPVYNGQIANFLTTSNYSMAVYDAYGTQQFYFPRVTGSSGDLLDFKDQLASADGVKLVGNAVDRRGDTMTGGLRVTGNEIANLIVGNLPLGNPGSDAVRDGVTVVRLLQNSPTNCHGFADKTFIDTATDYGGYGVFDATLNLKGAHTHNHVYSFQDRTTYAGSGVLELMKGLMSSPVHQGTGQINDRAGVYINDVLLQGTGNLQQQNGILIEHLQAGKQANVGVHIRQITGLAYYAPNGGRMFQNGVAGFGVDPSVSNFAINFRGSASNPFYGFASTDGNGMAIGVTGDTKMQLVAAGETRLLVKTAATFQRAVTPGNDNLTPCGDMVNRWSVLFAGTGTINTSDGREKTDPITVETLSGLMGQDPDAILDAWGDVSLIAFQWLNSIQEKGEDSARWHFGVIAQQVKKAFEEKGLDGTRLGLLCHDEWEDQFDIVPAEVIEHEPEYLDALDGSLQRIVTKDAWTEVVKPESKILVTHAGDRWGIRSDQCLWLEAAYQRRERQRLEDRVSNLERLFADK